MTTPLRRTACLERCPRRRRARAHGPRACRQQRLQGALQQLQVVAVVPQHGHEHRDAHAAKCELGLWWWCVCGGGGGGGEVRGGRCLDRGGASCPFGRLAPQRKGRSAAHR